MGLFDLPQELVDEIFDLAYPEEEMNYVNWEQWDSAEMEKKRNDSSYELRPFPQPKVCQFFISKRFLLEASRAWVGNQKFDITVTYDFFEALEPRFSWTCAYEKKDLNKVLKGFAWIKDIAGLLTFRVSPGFQPYTKTEADKRQWRRNVMALEEMLVATATGPKDEPLPSLPQYYATSSNYRSMTPSYPTSPAYYPTSPRLLVSGVLYATIPTASERIRIIFALPDITQPPPSISPVLSNFASLPLVISSVSRNIASTLPDVIHLQSNVTTLQLCVVAFVLPSISDEQSDIVSAWSDFTSLLSSIPSLFTLGRPHITRSQSNITCVRACREIILTRSDIPQGRLCDYQAYASAPKSPQQGAESPVYSPTTPMGCDEACLSRMQSEDGAASPKYSPTTPLVSPSTAPCASNSPKFCPTSPGYCGDSPSLCRTSSKYDSTRPRPPLPEHHVPEHIGHLVDASERSTGPCKEMDAGDVPGSVEEIIRLAVKNPKGFLGWLEKTKKPKTEATDAAKKICERNRSTAGSASRGLDTDVPFLDIAQTQRNFVEGSPLSKKMEPKTPNGGRKRRIDSSDIIDDDVTSKKRRITKGKGITDQDSRSHITADSSPPEQIKQGDATVRKVGAGKEESWLTLARAGEIESAADQLQSTIQSTLIVMGWPETAKHANLAGYMAFMVLMGKDEEHVRKELGGATLGLSRYDATADDLVRWLFRHVSLLEV
ncbi:unnamed protein product [Zymoseptoria tritici ST99CH_3D1]|nr:unnamed protein product [Zymoseptoria tritici ST99CH_3D1]